MADNTKIEWCDRTFNPWIGCTKVSTGCTNCYAAVETFVRKERAHGNELWGPKSNRHRTSEDYWLKPFSWNKQTWVECIEFGCGWRGEFKNTEFLGEMRVCPNCKSVVTSTTRQRVFCASMADVFEDNNILKLWRVQLFEMMKLLSNLDWLVLTKRPENISSLAPASWLIDWPENVWIGTTIENQEYADKRLPYLINIPAKVRFVSAEPLLSEIKLQHEFDGKLTRNWLHPTRGINWVITGGESGHNARPANQDWFISLRDQCEKSATAFMFKQWGEWEPTTKMVVNSQDKKYIHEWQDGTFSHKSGKKHTGRTLNGKIYNEFPK